MLDNIYVQPSDVLVNNYNNRVKGFSSRAKRDITWVLEDNDQVEDVKVTVSIPGFPDQTTTITRKRLPDIIPATVSDIVVVNLDDVQSSMSLIKSQKQLCKTFNITHPADARLYTKAFAHAVLLWSTHGVLISPDMVDVIDLTGTQEALDYASTITGTLVDLVEIKPIRGALDYVGAIKVATVTSVVMEPPVDPVDPVDPTDPSEPVEPELTGDIDLSTVSNIGEPGVWELDFTHIPINLIGEYKEVMSHRVIASAFPALIRSDDYTPDTLIRIQPETLALSVDGEENNFYIVPYANTSGFNFTGEMLVRVVTDPTNYGFVEGALDLAKLTNIGEMGVFEFKHRDYDNVTPDRYVSFIKEQIRNYILDRYEDSIGTSEIDDFEAILTVIDVTASQSFTPEVVAFSVTSTVPYGDLAMTGELLFKLMPETTVGTPKNILGNMSEVFEFEGRLYAEPDPYSDIRSYPLDARHGVPTSRIADYYYTYGGYDVDESNSYYAYQGGDVIKYVRGDSIFFVRANKPGVRSRVYDIQSEIIITRIDTNPEALDITTVTNCGEPGVLKVPMSLTGVYETDRTVYDDIAENAMSAVLAPYLFDAKYEGLVPDLGHYGRIPKTAFVRSGQPTDMVTGTLRVEPIEPDSTKVYLGDLPHDSGDWTSTLVDGELDTDTLYSEIIAKVLETTGVVIEAADLTNIFIASENMAVVYGADSNITGPTYGMLTVRLVPGT